MNQRRKTHSYMEALNRIAQANVALALCIGVVIRASLNFNEETTESPDPIWVLAVLVAAGVAIFTIPHLIRAIQMLPKRWMRIGVSIGSFAVQFAILQLLIAFVVD